MTQFIESLAEVFDTFDVAVLDQWGVMHDGSVAYPHAAAAMQMLADMGKAIVVVSNSGKRAALNLKRIGSFGLPAKTITSVVTSGEALWQALDQQQLKLDNKIPRMIYPICAKPGDATDWAQSSDAIELASEISESVDAIMLMGLPDQTEADHYDSEFLAAIRLTIPLICSNPDKTSPRAGGLVISPGALADRFQSMGGQVIWFGKPYSPIYHSIIGQFPEIDMSRFIMVGDSIEHDIAGAQQVGFRSALVRGGIHASDFGDASDLTSLNRVAKQLAAEANVDVPDFCLPYLA